MVMKAERPQPRNCLGKCEPPFKSAGAHFNPDHKKHGFVAEGPHAGDMPNLHIPASGDLEQEVLNPNLSFAGMLDADGAAVIMHAKADDYKSDPAGNAGDRVACGVIEKASPCDRPATTPRLSRPSAACDRRSPTWLVIVLRSGSGT
jgi:hypothetical protein